LRCSPALAALQEQRRTELLERAPRTAELLAATPALAAQATRVLLGSDFALAALIRDDNLLAGLWRQGALDTARDAASYAALVAELELAQAATEASYAAALRHLRRQEMLRLVWRDLTGTASLHQTLRETSWFAQAVIAGAARVAAALLVARHGRPPAAAGELVVLGMGKLGGSELNFSSDVDLVFLYPTGEGDTDGPAPLALEEYFTRQGRLLIRLLDAADADVGTSNGFTAKRYLRSRPVRARAPARPSNAPRAPTIIPCRSTRRKIRARSAPSAMRIPISR
jgi:glutamate-ammonia-ligase adenylyltransferase